MYEIYYSTKGFEVLHKTLDTQRFLTREVSASHLENVKFFSLREGHFRENNFLFSQNRTATPYARRHKRFFALSKNFLTRAGIIAALGLERI